jgi:DNA-binding MarR family transcriptional regulator
MDTPNPPIPEDDDTLACGLPKALDFYNPKNLLEGNSVGYMMRKVFSAVGQAVARELEPRGLTNAQWMPLLKLYKNGGMPVAELARECELDAGAMTRLTDRMEAKGLCSRTRSIDDRRVVILELTDHGRELAAEIPVVLSRVQNQHLAGFSHAEWEQLKDFLHRILDNAKLLQAQATGEKNED